MASSQPETAGSSGNSSLMTWAVWLYFALGIAFALVACEPDPRDHARLFTVEELALYDGAHSSPRLFLGVLGNIFDVTSGGFYSGDGGYSFFVGKDGSRAFTSGVFSGKAVDEVLDMEDGAIKGVYDWMGFYFDHEDYFFVGRLPGRYYDELGRPTEALAQVEAAVARVDETGRKVAAFNDEYPSCNSKWAKGKGRELWCSDDMKEKIKGSKNKASGERLVPRDTFIAPLNKSKCCCVELPLAKTNPGLYKVYENCNANAQRCKLPEVPPTPSKDDDKQ